MRTTNPETQLRDRLQARIEQHQQNWQDSQNIMVRLQSQNKLSSTLAVRQADVFGVDANEARRG